jgi:hypothetical protein
VAGWVDPNHEAGWFPLLGSRLYFIQACCGQVHWGCLQEPVEVANILEVLDCHEASPLIKNFEPRGLGRALISKPLIYSMAIPLGQGENWPACKYSLMHGKFILPGRGNPNGVLNRLAAQMIRQAR